MVREEVAESASSGCSESSGLVRVAPRSGSDARGRVEAPERAPLREAPTKDAKGAPPARSAKQTAKHSAPWRQQSTLTAFFKPRN